MVVTKKGEFKDATYDGVGWTLHFCNPEYPRMLIHGSDLERVCNYLKVNHGLTVAQVKESPGTVTLCFQDKRGVR